MNEVNEIKETKKEKSVLKKLINRKNAKLIGIIVASVIVVALIFTGFMLIYNGEEEVDTTYLIATLNEASELTTAELTYSGMSSYKDTGVAIISKSDYEMYYEATARIGIDVEKIKVSKDPVSKKIIVEIPKAEVLDVKIDHDSIKFYNVKFAIFNLNEKEDQNKALSLAEKAAKKEIGKIGALSMADKQAELIIKGLLSPAIPHNYEIEITQIKK